MKDGTIIVGRPGWHIECSAMSKKFLGETFDIHGGGIDLIFPHHENEIAQSEMANNKPLVNIWMHNGHVQINREKMSKSLGNFFTIKEVLVKTNPLVVRYFLLSTHYRMPIEFSDELLDQAKNSLERIHDFLRRLKSYKSKSLGLGVDDVLRLARAEFIGAMDDDFDISNALAVVFNFIRDFNRSMDENKMSVEDRDQVLLFMYELDRVLGILGERMDVSDSEIENLINERNLAREKKDFSRADHIRDGLKTRGIELDDTPGGTIWKRPL